MRIYFYGRNESATKKKMDSYMERLKKKFLGVRITAIEKPVKQERVPINTYKYCGHIEYSFPAKKSD